MAFCAKNGNVVANYQIKQRHKMNNIKNIIIIIAILLTGIAANAQSNETTLPTTEETTVVENKKEETKTEDKKEVETLAFYFNHKQLMKQVLRKTAYC